MAIVVAFTGCASRPDWREIANTRGYTKSWQAGRGYTHLVLDNGRSAVGGRLHVYIEGDGTPWLSKTEVAADPTPRHPLMLEAMTEDESAAVYIGRPCYFGRNSDPGCGTRAWTFERFSDATIQSMCVVALQLAREKRVRELWLFGHSGGGAIAVLMQECVPSAGLVMTIAAPLDTDAWTSLHGYTPLYGSLNPATRPLRMQAEELHLSGAKDNVTPAVTTIGYFERRPWARLLVIDEAGHVDCWLALWPQLLRRANRLADGDHDASSLSCNPG